MSARPGWAPANRLEFEPVPDLADLDRRIEEYLRRPVVNGDTQTKYLRQWGIWQRHCQALSVSPDDPPAEALYALICAAASGTLRADGSPVSGALAPQTLDVLLAGIREIGAQRRACLPFAEPDVEQTLRRLRRGHRRVFVAAGGSVDAAPAMTGADLHALCDVPPARTDRDAAIRALRLVSLDLSISLDLLATLTTDALTLIDERSSELDVAGRKHELVCGHGSEAEPGSCLRCSLHEAIDRHPTGDGALFAVRFSPDGAGRADKPANRPWLRRALVTTAEWWQHVEVAQTPTGELLRFRPDATSPDRAATRMGIAVACAANGLWWLRMRALLTLTFSFGLGLNEAITEIGRSDVTGGGKGLRIRIPQVDAPLPVPVGDGPACASTTLGQWVAVRDAATGAELAVEQPLFCQIAAKGTGLSPAEAMAARGEEWMQRAQRGLPFLGHLTGLSPRAGFAARLADAGVGTLELRDALRLVKPETSLRHRALAGDAALRAAREITARLGETS